jgi:hypothetical protein
MICGESHISNHGANLFRDEETAKRILQVFLSINDQMDDAIRSVEDRTSAEEFKAFKRGVGHVMYEVFEQIVEPICEQHPSLRPPEMEPMRKR